MHDRRSHPGIGPAALGMVVAGIVVAMVFAVVHTTVAAPAAQQAGTPRRLNRFIEILEKGEVAKIGVDMYYIDYEHNVPAFQDLASRVAGAWQRGLPTLIRVMAIGEEDPTWMVKQVLDAGVMGVRFARIENRAQTERAIRAMRYPPQRGSKIPEPVGLRGCCGQTMIKLWGLSQAEYLRRADVWPLNPEGELYSEMIIETGLGVKNINEILGTPGVSGIIIGHGDLGLSLGVGPSPTPERERAIEAVGRACAAQKKVACGVALGTSNVATGDAELKLRVSQGYRVIQVPGAPQ